MPERSFGGMLAQAAIGGAVGAADSKVKTLEEQAKEAKETRLANLAKKNMIEINQQEQGARAAADKIKADQQQKQFDTTVNTQKEQFGVTTDLTREGMLADERHAKAQIALGYSQLAEQKRATDIASQTQKDLQSMRADQDLANITAEQKAKIQTVKDSLELTESDRKQRAVSNIEGMKQTPGWDKLDPVIKEHLTLQAMVNDKIDPVGLVAAMTDAEVAKKSGKNGLKGASADVMKELRMNLENDRAFKNLNPYQQNAVIVADSVKAANPEMLDKFGTTSIKDDAVLPVAEALIKGEYTGYDLVYLDPGSREKVLAMVGTLAKGKAKFADKVKEDKGALQGPVPTNTAVQEDVSGFESSGKGANLGMLMPSFITDAAAKQKKYLSKQ